MAIFNCFLYPRSEADRPYSFIREIKGTRWNPNKPIPGERSCLAIKKKPVLETIEPIICPSFKKGLIFNNSSCMAKPGKQSKIISL